MRADSPATSKDTADRSQSAVGDDALRELLEDAQASPPDSIEAHTYLDRKPSFSKPVLLRCEDGHDYWVKARRVDEQQDKAVARSIVNDQVLGVLGRVMHAPVPPVVLINVPQELIDGQPEMKHMRAGLAHGSQLIANVTDKKGIGDAAVKVDGNRDRLSRLAILYGLAHGNDQQLVYKTDGTRLVFSVDHGHFFPGGPDWKREQLDPSGAVEADERLVKAHAITAEELKEAATGLTALSDETICSAIARPPDDWGVHKDDRLALARYLTRRRDRLCELYLKETRSPQ